MLLIFPEFLTNDDRLPTNDEPLPTNDEPLPTSNYHKASIYRQAIELPTVSAKVGDHTTPPTSVRPWLASVECQERNLQYISKVQ